MSKLLRAAYREDEIEEIFGYQMEWTKIILLDIQRLYIVKTHFSKTRKDTMQDKICCLIRRNIEERNI